MKHCIPGLYADDRSRWWGLAFLAEFLDALVQISPGLRYASLAG